MSSSGGIRDRDRDGDRDRDRDHERNHFWGEKTGSRDFKVLGDFRVWGLKKRRD